jgi:5-methylcytosine-specific restriction endonuclease McrA
MPEKKRNYKKEYENYQGKPDQLKNRAERNAARAIVKKKVGVAAIKGKDVDHKKPIVKGGTNSKSNLRLASPSKNRSFARTKTAGMK